MRSSLTAHHHSTLLLTGISIIPIILPIPKLRCRPWIRYISRYSWLRIRQSSSFVGGNVDMLLLTLLKMLLLMLLLLLLYLLLIRLLRKLLLLTSEVWRPTILMSHFLLPFIKRRPRPVLALNFPSLSLYRLHRPPFRLIDTRKFQPLAPPAWIQRRRIRSGEQTTKFDRSARETRDLSFCWEL
jgi:hypothetical protein